MPLDFIAAPSRDAASRATAVLSLDQPLFTSLANVGFRTGALASIAWHNDAKLCSSRFPEILSQLDSLTNAGSLSPNVIAWLREFRSLVQDAENKGASIYVFCD